MFIRVVPYDPFWEVEYENESQKIKNILKVTLKKKASGKFGKIPIIFLGEGNSRKKILKAIA